ncbi:polysaccharide biosynthesis/export family protein [Simkania negevensis]|uniref:Polysaccharide biosynthesis/export family protein n=1 Tax=Simkania negevensis TaxID=83561 RepID=A0ABS3APV7_9BACT|nr:polysaccharide biosynthesis/export family protein [Simkania negevensis]
MRFFPPLLVLSLFIAVCTVSCSRTYKTVPYQSSSTEDFVLDSYKIRQGKFSILEMEGNLPAKLDPKTLEEYIDVVANDDILLIVLYHPSRKDLMEEVGLISSDIGYQVVDGKIELPDLGPVEVAGLPLEEARRKVEEKYRQEIPDVQIYMVYKARLMKKVELAGMVSRSDIPVDGKLRLFDLLAKVKIPNDANLFKSYLVRDGTLLPVDMRKLLHEGDMGQNVVMHGGDKVFIAAADAAHVMLMGEVGSPRIVAAPRGYLSLRDAIVQAGGILFTGNKRRIQVIRGNIANPKIYTLNWDEIVNIPNHSLLVMTGDTVYVTSKPITEWNRFIDQLLPSFGGVVALKATYNTLGGR